jgi:hypothetical protein
MIQEDFSNLGELSDSQLRQVEESCRVIKCYLTSKLLPLHVYVPYEDLELPLTKLKFMKSCEYLESWHVISHFLHRDYSGGKSECEILLDSVEPLNQALEAIKHTLNKRKTQIVEDALQTKLVLPGLFELTSNPKTVKSLLPSSKGSPSYPFRTKSQPYLVLKLAAERYEKAKTTKAPSVVKLSFPEIIDYITKEGTPPDIEATTSANRFLQTLLSNIAKIIDFGEQLVIEPAKSTANAPCIVFILSKK